jgi:hypothetical protein
VTPPIVLSASRRTDIPAFYLDWFLAGLDKGRFNVTNPFNGRVSVVPADPDSVHTIVFWSKDFGPFLQSGAGRLIERKGYHLFFNFTLNSADPLLEPRMPPLAGRLDQLAELGRRFDPRSISWRFDPICYYRGGDGVLHNNLEDFPRIAERAGKTGVRRCVVSFVDLYAKVRRRLESLPAMAFEDPPPATMRRVLVRMAEELTPLGIELKTCCEKEVLEGLAPEAGIGQNACIDHDLLMDLFGGSLSRQSDMGQRRRDGCRCHRSMDIGSYREQPCGHGCLYCYANPKITC